MCLRHFLLLLPLLLLLLQLLLLLHMLLYTSSTVLAQLNDCRIVLPRERTSNDHIQLFAHAMSVRNSFISEPAPSNRDSPFFGDSFDETASSSVRLVSTESVAVAFTRVTMSAVPGVVLLQDVDDLVVQWKRCLDAAHAMQSVCVTLPHLAMRIDK